MSARRHKSVHRRAALSCERAWSSHALRCLLRCPEHSECCARFRRSLHHHVDLIVGRESRVVRPLSLSPPQLKGMSSDKSSFGVRCTGAGSLSGSARRGVPLPALPSRDDTAVRLTVSLDLPSLSV